MGFGELADSLEESGTSSWTATTGLSPCQARRILCTILSALAQTAAVWGRMMDNAFVAYTASIPKSLVLTGTPKKNPYHETCTNTQVTTMTKKLPTYNKQTFRPMMRICWLTSYSAQLSDLQPLQRFQTPFILARTVRKGNSLQWPI
jgi:hypothetical protein